MTDFHDDAGQTTDQIMKAYTDATRRLLSHPTLTCGRIIKRVHLIFYLDVVNSGETGWLEFAACGDVDRPSDDQLALFGQQLMSFSLAHVTNLLNTWNKLKLLSLRSCELAQESALEIDAPTSKLCALELIRFGCIQVDLTCLPKLRQLIYDTWYGETPPVSFGCVPQLDQIWIKPKDPLHLRPIFSKLRDVHLYNIFAKCDLILKVLLQSSLGHINWENSWILSRHSCKLSNYEASANKTNLVWETSNFKHLNLKLLPMEGFEEVEKMMNYIRLVMEQACNAINLELPKFPVDELSKQRVREKLSYGLSSSAEIIIG
ncbi:hypothetical protein VPH35_027899 [Triticum aestivum]